MSKTAPPSTVTTPSHGPITLPRITIAFCTQCKWNLRAAYYAQELLQTFSTSLGEVALLPSTSGTFVITLYHASAPKSTTTMTTTQTGDRVEDEGVRVGQGMGREGEEKVRVQTTVIWDRKVDGGFPETKELKGRVRDVLEPERGLGHTDRALGKTQKVVRQTKEVEESREAKDSAPAKEGLGGDVCQDCS